MSAELAERSRMYRVMKTVEQMCLDRRMPGPSDWAAKSMEDFAARYCHPNGAVAREKMTLQCREVPRGQFPKLSADVCMVVFFSGEATLTATQLEDFRKAAEVGGFPRVLVIHKGKMTARIRLALAPTNGVKMECIEEERLVVNITQHELVPRHEPLDAVELKEVLEAHSLTADMLPRILASDPVCIYFGLEKGRVVRITRTSETAGEYVTYRRVV